MKKFTIIFFIFYISIFLTISMTSEDKKISSLENKILNQFVLPNFNNIKSGKFMSSFEDYTNDQFPYRELFLQLRNLTNYILGNREFRNIYITKSGRLVENFQLNEKIYSFNINKINNLIEKLNLPTKILLIPTSLAFYEDELPRYAIYDNQMDLMQFYKLNLLGELYNPYDLLSTHKDEFIYFKTDHHWTQLGAKYVYEEMFNKNIDSPYKLISTSFLGSYYSKVLLPFIHPDEMYAFTDYKTYSVQYNLNSTLMPLYNDSKLNSKNKYQYFLNGDPAQAVVYGEGKEEILIFKDSYAHNFIPFLVQDFSKIHIIDPRYYNGNINEYLKINDNITQIFFIHNLASLNSDKLYSSLKIN